MQSKTNFTQQPNITQIRKKEGEREMEVLVNFMKKKETCTVP
jgi:hypothetical protein